MQNTLPRRVQDLPVQFSVVVHRSKQALMLTERYCLGDILEAAIIDQSGKHVRTVAYAFCQPVTLYLVASRFPNHYYLVEYSEDLHMPVCSCRERVHGWCSHCQKVADLIGLLV
jgi:hypothetical protein